MNRTLFTSLAIVTLVFAAPTTSPLATASPAPTHLAEKMHTYEASICDQKKKTFFKDQCQARNTGEATDYFTARWPYPDYTVSYPRRVD